MIKMFIARPPGPRGHWVIWEAGTRVTERATQAEAVAVDRARALARFGMPVALKQERADGGWDDVAAE